MRYNIYINELVDRKLWIDLLNRSKFTSPFQTPEFFDFFNHNHNMKASVFALGNKMTYDALCVVTLQKEKGVKGYFSRRAIIYGGIVLSDEAINEEVQYFLSAVSNLLTRSAIYFEIRNFFNYSVLKASLYNSGWSYSPHLNFQLSLKNVSKESIIKKFKYNRRREIKQSISEGATYGLCENEKEIEAVYSILHDLYKTKVKLPLPSLSYFLSLFRAQIAQVFVVKHQGKIIGGSICPYIDKRAIYTYYYCGLRNYHKKIFPTHLAVVAAMEYAIDKSIPIIDFMGAGKPGDHYGVRDYKSQFGGELVEHGRFIKVLNPFLYAIGKLGLKVLSKLK